MTCESYEKSEFMGRNCLFHVLISLFAPLKCWHLEVSFAESEINCFRSDTSKEAFSIPLTPLTVTPAAAGTSVDENDMKHH